MTGAGGPSGSDEGSGAVESLESTPLLMSSINGTHPKPRSA